MGHRLKNMQSAWDTFNIPPPPVDNAAASSTAVNNKVHIQDSNLKLNSKKSEEAKIQIESNKNIEIVKRELIKSGRYNASIPDSELVKSSLNNK